MSYKDVSNISELPILNIFCDKMNFSPPPSFYFTCLSSLHIHGKSSENMPLLGLKDQSLAIFNDMGELFEPSAMHEMW